MKDNKENMMNAYNVNDEDLTQVAGGTEGETLYGEEDGPRYIFESEADRQRVMDLVEQSKDYVSDYRGTERDAGGIIERPRRRTLKRKLSC